MRDHLLKVRETLKNPLVIVSLVLGVLGAPPLLYSGIFMGQGRDALGALLFSVYVLIYTLDAIVTLTLLINRGK